MGVYSAFEKQKTYLKEAFRICTKLEMNESVLAQTYSHLKHFLLGLWHPDKIPRFSFTVDQFLRLRQSTPKN